MADGLSCPECRAYFEPRRRDQGFCSTKCNAAANARELARARRVYRALYHWRLAPRKKGMGALAGVAANWRFVCAEVAAWICEDRDAQRKPPPPHDHDANRGHQRAPQGVKL